MRDVVKTIIERYGDRELPLHVRGDAWKVVIGCILSQRTRDETTDKAFGKLLKKLPTLKDIARANVKTLEELIYPVGFYRQKAQIIKKAAEYMLKNGVRPSLEELMKIPGVGRKCANIVLSYGFGMPAIAVDTHVERVSKRLGIADENDTPEKVEAKLKEILPREWWIYVNNAFVKFGKEVCKPLRPRCDICPVSNRCKYFIGRIDEQ